MLYIVILFSILVINNTIIVIGKREFTHKIQIMCVLATKSRNIACVRVVYMYKYVELYIADSDCLYLYSQRHYLCQIVDENCCALNRLFKRLCFRVCIYIVDLC